MLLSFVYVLFSFSYAVFSFGYVLFSFRYVPFPLFALFMRSFYVLSLCALFMRSFYVLFLCALFMCSFYALFLMRSLYSLFLCALIMCSLYALFLCALFMCCFYAHFSCAHFMHFFYALFSCAILMCSFHKCLAILRMHKKYYCIKVNMADNKMDNVLKKLGLSHYRERFFEEKISTDRNAIMSLRIECSTFGLCTPQRAVETNKFVIPKILIENLIDDGFSVKEMSNILCVPERTALRRMVEYGLTIRNFPSISDDQLDSDVLALKNDYPFCGETILRELLKGRGIIIQRFQLRDSMHPVSEVGIQSRRNGRLKTRVYNVKGANHLWYIDTNHKLVKWYLIIFGTIDNYIRLPVSWNALVIIRLLQSWDAV